jgi:NADH-quinone oxidoreductase subunit M
MLAGTGVIWAAVYMLWMLQRVVFGTKTSEANRKLTDMNLREAMLMLPLLVLMFFMGVYPAPFLNRSRDAIEAARQRIAGPAASAPAEVVHKLGQK